MTDHPDHTDTDDELEEWRDGVPIVPAPDPDRATAGDDVAGPGDTAECDLCGGAVPLARAVPNPRDEPVHRECYADAYGGPEWLTEY